MVLHIFAHNFLNIQQIFNLQKVLESWDLGLFQPYHQMLSMLEVSKVILTFDTSDMLQHT